MIGILVVVSRICQSASLEAHPSLRSYDTHRPSMLFTNQDGTISAAIPPELALLISDSLEAPATFLLVEQLAAALKSKRKCILVGTAQSFEHYAALGRKQVRTAVTAGNGPPFSSCVYKSRELTLALAPPPSCRACNCRQSGSEECSRISTASLPSSRETRASAGP